MPVPISRVRGVGLVEAYPEAHAKIEVSYNGILKKLKVRDGDTVKEGDVLAEFTNIDAESRLLKARREEVDSGDKHKALAEERRNTKRRSSEPSSNRTRTRPTRRSKPPGTTSRNGSR